MPPGCYQNQAGLDPLAPGSRATYSIDIVDSPRIPLAALVHRGDYHGIVATFDVLVGLIAAGRYAKLTHVGSHSELERPYTWLYRTWLPSSGEETSDHPCPEENKYD